MELISCKLLMSQAASESLFVFWWCKRSKQWRQHIFEWKPYHYTETSSFLRKYCILTSSKSRRFHRRYQNFFRKWYLEELEKVPEISNILCSSWDILKNQKISGVYMHTDISRTAMNFLGWNIFRCGHKFYL